MYTLLIFVALLNFARMQVFHHSCNITEGALDKTRGHNHHITDVFFVVTQLNKYSHVTSGPVAFVLKALEDFALPSALGTPGAPVMDTRVHVLTDLPQLLDSSNHVGSIYHFHDMNAYRDQSSGFFDVYKRTHATVNSVEYEFLCFNRWMMIGNITEKWNREHKSELSIQRILALDLDVLMTMNAHQFVGRVLHTLSTPRSFSQTQEHFYVAVIGLGAIQIFSAPGIKHYVDYMLQFFYRPVEEVQESLKAYGRFFSDMMLMKEYIVATKGNTTLRNACLEYWRANEYYQWKEEPVNKMLLQRLGCVPMTGFREMMVGNDLSYYRDFKQLKTVDDAFSSVGELLLRGSREQTPYCLLHFQGKDSKPWLYLYSVLQHHLVQRNASLGRSSVPLMALHTHRRKASFLLAGDEHRLSLHPTNGNFLRKNFSQVLNVYDVPWRVLELFEVGQALDA